MNFMQRLSLASTVLFRGTKALAHLVPSWQDEKPVYSNINFESMVRHGWRKNELIFACVDRTANTAAQVKLKVKDTKGNELPDHPLRRLLRNPNPYMSEFDFWASVHIFQKLAGRAVYEKERSRAGQVVRLWPLRPDWLAVIPSNTAVIKGYEYAPPGMSPVQLAPEDVLDFKLFDPLSMYNGWPPAAVASRVGDVDNSATDYLKIFFDKGGMPPVYLKTSKVVGDPLKQAIREGWAQLYGGSRHWAEPAVLDADFEVHKTGLSFDEMKIDVLDARNEVRVCMVMAVPPLIVGAKAGLDRSTYSNAEQMRTVWWEDILIPAYINLNDTIYRSLALEFGVETEWDFSQTPAMVLTRQKAFDTARNALSGGGVTLNEYREMINLPTLGAAGEVFLRTLAQTEVPAPARGSKAIELHSHTPPEHKGAMPPDLQERTKAEKDLKKAVQATLKTTLANVKTELEKTYVGR